VIHLHGIQPVVREDEQRPPIRAAEQDLNRPLGHVDLTDERA
jgi:hypothetical protein